MPQENKFVSSGAIALKTFYKKNPIVVKNEKNHEYHKYSIKQNYIKQKSFTVKQNHL